MDLSKKDIQDQVLAHKKEVFGYCLYRTELLDQDVFFNYHTDVPEENYVYVRSIDAWTKNETHFLKLFEQFGRRTITICSPEIIKHEDWKHYSTATHMFYEGKSVQYKNESITDIDVEPFWETFFTCFCDRETKHLGWKEYIERTYENSSTCHRGILDGDVAASIGMLMQTDKISSIWAIATLPEYRRKGYATKILKDLLSETTKPSFLTVAKGHKEAEDAYNKAGFRAKFDLNWYTKRGS